MFLFNTHYLKCVCILCVRRTNGSFVLFWWYFLRVTKKNSVFCLEYLKTVDFSRKIVESTIIYQHTFLIVTCYQFESTTQFVHKMSVPFNASENRWTMHVTQRKKCCAFCWNNKVQSIKKSFKSNEISKTKMLGKRLVEIKN